MSRYADDLPSTTAAVAAATAAVATAASVAATAVCRVVPPWGLRKVSSDFRGQAGSAGQRDSQDPPP